MAYGDMERNIAMVMTVVLVAVCLVIAAGVVWVAGIFGAGTIASYVIGGAVGVGAYFGILRWLN